MQWYKHDADASNDAKIKKLLLKHGAYGYAVYFHCLELIAGNISENNITFELEHDSEIIADNLKIKGTADQSGRDIVESIMKDIISFGLFEEKNGHIFCFKMLKRLDSSMTSNVKLRQLIIDGKDRHDTVMIPSCKKRRDKNRLDEKRKDKKTPAVVNIDFVPEILKPTVKAFIEYRKQIKKQLTDLALKLTLDELNKWYPLDYATQKKCIEKTIMNGWIGVFKLKDEEPPKKEVYNEDKRRAQLIAERGEM